MAPHEGKLRHNMKAIISLCVAGAALAGAVSCGGGSTPAQAAELRVNVGGMHCEGCAEGITRKLKRQKGVLETDVHFSNVVQVIRYDAARVDASSLVAVISNAGFSVSSGSP